VPSRPERPEGLIIVLRRRRPAAAEAGEIVLADGELAEFAFIGPAEVPALVTPLWRRRIAACLEASSRVRSQRWRTVTTRLML